MKLSRRGLFKALGIGGAVAVVGVPKRGIAARSSSTYLTFYPGDFRQISDGTWYIYDGTSWRPWRR